LGLRLKDVVDVRIPSTQVGRYPKPSWYQHTIGDRGWTEICNVPDFLESYTDAVRAIITEQETAGMDIVTDGCLRYDMPPYFAPGTSIASWGTNALAYLSGARRVEARPKGPTLLDSIIGEENSNSFFRISGLSPGEKGYFWVFDEEPSIGNLDLWLETAKIGLAYSTKAFKFSGPSAAMSAFHSFNRSSKSDRDVYFALHKVENEILHKITKAGCRIIQLDFPFGMAHWMAQFNQIDADKWSVLIDAFNEQIEGVEANIWVHFCFGAPILYSHQTLPMQWHMANVYPHLGEFRADCIQSEAANTHGRHLDQELKAWQEQISEKDYAVGAVTPYNLTETYEDADKIVNKALEYVPPEKLALTSDEGLAGNGFMTRRGALIKMRLLAGAADRARRKLEN
jgi:5-methyltetrahydropteroyltriglutamate--homocysteine methyltransferase